MRIGNIWREQNAYICKDSRRATFGISKTLTKTFTVLAQASDAGRWVRASPQKIKN
ncbi:MAG: hypothetical protein MPL62_11695 [Alphaproteobacteria bacterium]|nr:hypothetical protein [Alphaproteobacteria bacterium]